MISFDDKGFPVVQLSNDGWSSDEEATATCFCGAVQLVLVSFLMFAVANLASTLTKALSLFKNLV